MSNSKVAELKPEFANMFIGDEFPNHYDEATKRWQEFFEKQITYPGPNTIPLPTVIKDTRGTDLDIEKYKKALNETQKTTEPSIGKAVKYDDGKDMYQLIPPYALEQAAKAFTFGYHKYEKEAGGGTNWKKGMSWSKLMGALERHYQAFKSGEDFASDSGIYHLGHLMACAMMLTDYYRSNPQFDDREKSYLKMPKIVLDIDEVVCSWTEGYLKKYGEESKGLYWDASYKIGDRLKELESDEEFWVNLPMLHRPDFVPHAYISSRSIPIEWTMKFLEKNDLPCRPVHHVPWGASKVEKLKEVGAELFIDDRFDNMKEAEEAGITTFLMDSHHNKHYNVGYRRIYDLSLRNIVR